jgi:Glycosyl transferase family 11
MAVDDMRRRLLGHESRAPVNVVVARLIGGLGNQMFQYAAGRALALRCGASLKLDLSGFAAYPKRHYELDDFPICAAPASDADRAEFGFRASGAWAAWGRRVRRLLGVDIGPTGAPVYSERHFHFDPRVRDLTPPVFLDGYWQSEKYFADCAELLRREFTPHEPLDAANADIATRIAAVEAVSLHVRRGDYVSELDVSRYHGICRPDYYRSAVDYIAQRVQDIHLFVFSDDRDWVRDNLRFDLPTTLVAANSPDRGFRDMQLMARCRHHIVANSSFSWWGAWLNPSPTKVVVAPSRWFGADNIDTRDLLPESWVKL